MSSHSELAFEVPFPLTMSLSLRTAISLPSVAFGLQTSDSLAPEIHPTARPPKGREPLALLTRILLHLLTSATDTDKVPPLAAATWIRDAAGTERPVTQAAVATTTRAVVTLIPMASSIPVLPMMIQFQQLLFLQQWIGKQKKAVTHQ